MKKIFVITLAGLLAFSMTACGDKAPEKDPVDTESSIVDTTVDNSESKPDVEIEDSVTKEDSEEVTEEGVKLTKSQQVAYDFAKAIQTGDYETAMGMIDIKDTTFLTAADLEWFIPRSDFSDIQDTDYALVEATSNGDKVRDVVTLNLKPVSVDVTVALNDDNEWKVEFNDFFIENWTLEVPKNVKIKLNDIEIASTYLDSKEENVDIYILPAVANRKATVIATSSVYGDFTMEVTPSYEKYTVVCKIDNEKASEMFGQVKDMLNKMNEAYEAGETDFSKFVSSKADPQLAVTIATCVTNQYTWNNSLSPWNIRFTIVEGLSEYEGKAYIPAELLQDDVVTMVVKVEKTWDKLKHNSGSDYNRDVGRITVQVEDGEMKIFKIAGSDNIIESRNSMTREW